MSPPVEVRKGSNPLSRETRWALRSSEAASDGGARERTGRSATTDEKKRGSSEEEARKQRRSAEAAGRGESRKTEGRKTKDSIMNLDDDRVLFHISFDIQITNPISSISLVFLLVLAHPGGRREGQRRASIVSQ